MQHPLDNSPLPRLRAPLDIPTLLGECIKASALRKVRFSKIYPNETVSGPVIVWRLIRRVLGKEGKETKKPRIRGWEVLDDKLVEYWGQWTTATFQFDLFHASEEEVDELMHSFELFIREARPTLGLSGVDSFILDEQVQDYSLPVPKEIPVRSLRYTATMSTMYPVYKLRIHQIALSVSSLYDRAETEVTRQPDGLMDTVEVKLSKIMSIGTTPEPSDADYIVGVDYDLIDAGSGKTNIKWSPHGLRPESGETYYVRYTTQTDPLSFVVAG